MATDELRLERERAVLLIVDFQERLAAAMAPGDVGVCERNIALLIELARQVRIPVVVSEQYPKGLGPTAGALRVALAEPGLTIHRLEKIEFACTDAPAFAEIYRSLRRDQWIVAGMETHICVYQTVRGLTNLGARVHVPADAVVSRAPTNVHLGIGLCGRAGAVITSTETVVFDVLGRAGTDEFRAISRMLK